MSPLDSSAEQSHTEWAKERALAYVDQGQLKVAIDSMVSDLSKDPARPREQQSMIAMMALDLRNKPNLTKEEVTEWINGFA